MSEELESAFPRQWVVSIRSKLKTPRHYVEQILVVRATNEQKAKEAAVRKMRQGPRKHMTFTMWEFPSVEEVKNE